MREELLGKKTRNRRSQERKRPLEVGLLRSRRSLSAGQPTRPEIPRKASEKAWKGQSPFHPCPQARASRLLHDEAEEALLPRSFSHRLTEQKARRALRLTGALPGIRPDDA